MAALSSVVEIQSATRVESSLWLRLLWCCTLSLAPNENGSRSAQALPANRQRHNGDSIATGLIFIFFSCRSMTASLHLASGVAALPNGSLYRPSRSISIHHRNFELRT